MRFFLGQVIFRFSSFRVRISDKVILRVFSLLFFFVQQSKTVIFFPSLSTCFILWTWLCLSNCLTLFNLQYARHTNGLIVSGRWSIFISNSILKLGKRPKLISNFSLSSKDLFLDKFERELDHLGPMIGQWIFFRGLAVCGVWRIRKWKISKYFSIESLVIKMVSLLIIFRERRLTLKILHHTKSS